MEDFQHEAKKSFAIGACMYKKAYREFKSAAMYAERLPKTPENQHLLATLYANCGLIQMKRENYRLRSWWLHRDLGTSWKYGTTSTGCGP